MSRALVPYQSYEYDELLALLRSGRVDSIRDMAERWRHLHRSLVERAEALKKGLDRLDDAWEGDAAEIYLAKMRKLENTIRTGAEAARANWNALEDAADGLDRAQLDSPVLRPMGSGLGGAAEGGAGGAGGGDFSLSQKSVIITRLHDVDDSYFAARDRLQTAPYEGPPPDAALDPGPGDDSSGDTELAGSPASGGAGATGGTLPPGGGAGGGAALPGRGIGGPVGGGQPAPVPPGAAGAAGRAGTAGAAGRGAMPMGAATGGGGQDRKRNTWLQETDDVWGTKEAVAPRVLGFDPDV